MQLVQGLTQQEVRARQQRGETNAASFRSSRSYWDIIRANLFNFFNNILFAIGIALIALGQYNDAFTSVGQGVGNALIGTVQEINAKRKLDKIALLTRTRVRVIRDGQKQAIDPGELVKGDVVLARQVAEWSDRGLRVLLFASNPNATSLHDAAGQPQLPPLTPLGLVALADELRPQAKETIAAFANLGIQLKIISGDNPQTVAALAKQAGLPANLRLVSGPELAQLPPEVFDQVAAETTVFGRIAPEQKEQIVASLIRQGHYVAMMGDGVNDALSLKKAQLGIAMESGSNVTRNVADMILLNDSFAALLPALTEGKRIIGGLSISLYLFLTRVVTSMLIIIAIRMSSSADRSLPGTS